MELKTKPIQPNRKRSFGAFCVALFFLAGLGVGAALPTNAAPAKVAAIKTTPAQSAPLEITLHDHGFAPGHFDQDVARLKQLATTFHATSLKFDCGWNNVEAEEGKYNFWYVDYMCSVAAAADVKVKLIANNGWSVPNWLWRHKAKEPFALNSAGETGRQGQSADSEIGKYPAPVLLAYSNPWVRDGIRAWQGALVRHVEKKFPGLVNQYICEGEIYLNPDNNTGNLLFDYNPWTIRMFRTWLKSNPASPYYGDLSPDRAKSAGRVSFNLRWKTNYKQWKEIEPPREFKADSVATRDWCAFLQWYVAWSYQQVASGLRAQTRLPITFLLNTFTGVPMPNDHVWGPSRTQDEYWLIFKMTAPYVTSLGVTAYPYDPGWEVDASGQWNTRMSFLSTCSRLLRRPIQIVEGGGTTNHVRTLSDLRWQFFSAYSHNLADLDLGYFDMPEGTFPTYTWNQAVAFPETKAVSRYYTSIPREYSPSAPRIAVLYASQGELLAPGNGTEGKSVRAIGRYLRDAHYQFDVLDTLALDGGDASLQDYRAVFLPSSVVLSGKTRLAVQRFHQAGGLLLLSDQAGSRDLWGSPIQSLFGLLSKKPTRLVRLDSEKLAAEQEHVDQMGVARDTQPSWIETLKKHVRPEMNASPYLAVSRRRPLMVFNRSAEQVVRVTLPGQKTQDVPPGQEAPPRASPAPPPRRDQPVIFDDPQSWVSFGVLRPLARRNQDSGLALVFPAFPGGSLAETGLHHSVPDLTAASSLSLALTVKGEEKASLPSGTRILLRLSSTQTGRAYEVNLPYPTNEEQTVSFDLAKDFKIPNARRRQEIDRVALLISGVRWPHIEWSVRSLRFLPTIH